MTYASILKDIEKQKFVPLYFFCGEEFFQIEKMVKLIEAKALNPGEESFNKAVLYGPETNFERVMSETRSFPMMAERRLVVLKEAQKFKDFEKLTHYFENPVPSTVFVVVWKGKGPDGRLKASKALKKTALFFEGKKVYEKECRSLADEYARSKGFKIQDQALMLLVSFLGNNPGLIESELDKIFLNLRAEGKHLVDPEIVYEMINIDKDFNVFELMNALGDKDHNRAHLIISKMARNTKEYPPILILSQLFGFYDKLALLQSKGAKTDNDIANILGITPFIARQYQGAVRRVSLTEAHRNLGFLLDADLQMKGIQTTHMGDEHVMKTLVFKLLN